MKIYSGIYQIRNLVNNKIYIGSSKNLGKRKKEHFNLLDKKNHYNRFLQRAYNKYEKKNFVFEILEIVLESKKSLLEIEQNYLDLIQPYQNTIGYNSNSFARGGYSTINYSPKEKIAFKLKIKRKPIPIAEEVEKNIIFLYVQEEKSLRDLEIIYDMSLTKLKRLLTNNNIHIRNHKECITRRFIDKQKIQSKKQIKLKCKYCSRLLDKGNFAQYHGEKCKMRTI